MLGSHRQSLQQTTVGIALLIDRETHALLGQSSHYRHCLLTPLAHDSSVIAHYQYSAVLRRNLEMKLAHQLNSLVVHPMSDLKSRMVHYDSIGGSRKLATIICWHTAKSVSIKILFVVCILQYQTCIIKVIGIACINYCDFTGAVITIGILLFIKRAESNALCFSNFRGDFCRAAKTVVCTKDDTCVCTKFCLWLFCNVVK